MTRMRGRELALWLGLGVLAVVLVATGGVAISYSEVTDQVGIDFQTAGEVHPENGTGEWPAFPEIMGAGGCIGDIDGDGYDDVYLVNQRYNAENPATEGWIDKVDPRNELYLNDGDGTFTETTGISGANSDAWGYGCSLGDYDADGDVDLFVGNFGANELYENTGNGTFVNVTDQAGVSGHGVCGEHRCMSTSSAWADYDEDGDLDLYVGNYVDTNVTDAGRGPGNHDAQHNFLYRNDGDGTFTEVADEAGVAGKATDLDGSKTLGVVWFDADQDGDLDLYAANDEVPNDYYENQGDGTFVEKSLESNLDDDRAGMGVTAQDYDADGYDDLFFTHYKQETNGFYRNLGDGTFEDRSGEDDQLDALPVVGWGTRFVDVDRDADLDIFVANGHTEPKPDDYEQMFLVYSQDREPDAPPADPYWENATATWGLDNVERRVTRGLAMGDLDLDGDVDAVGVSNGNQTAQVLKASGVDNHHLTIRLDQPGENPNAIGARIGVTVDGETMYQTLRTGTSYLSQHSLALGFGLGVATVADEVTVEWPDGGVTSFTDVEADQVIRIDRATGSFTDDTIAPETSVTLEGTDGDNGWFVSPVEATVDATDRGTTRVSGVVEIQHALDEAAWTTGTGPVTIDEGVHGLHHRAEDAVGNTEPRRTTMVRVDLTPPTALHTIDGTLGEAGWYVSDTVNVTLVGADALSGVDHLEYRLDDGDWTTYEDPISLDEDGIHEIEYRAVDRAGHVGATEATTVKLDATSPNVTWVKPAAGQVYLGSDPIVDLLTGPAYVTTLPSDAGLGGSTFDLLVDAEDETSGVDAVRVDRNDTRFKPPDAQAPYAWIWDTSTDPSGIYELEAIAGDVAGNEAADPVRLVLVGATPSNLATTADDGPSTFVRIGGQTP